MKRIGIIGDKDSVLCFMAAGFSVFITEEEKEAADIIRSAISRDYSVLFVTEELYVRLNEIIEKYKSSPELAILPLPGKGGSMGVGLSNIKSAVEKAVGADILK